MIPIMTMPKGLTSEEKAEWGALQRANKRQYYLRKREHFLQKSKEYREANPEKVADAKRRIYLRNPNAVKAKVSKWVSENPERAKATKKRYSDKLSSKKRVLEWQRIRRTDPLVALETNLRSIVRFAFKREGYKKPGKAERILGAPWVAVKTHIETQFRDGMTWENRGMRGWHVDHIIPLASANTQEELLRLCHYTNLQPLWGHENMKKSSRLPCGTLVRKKRAKTHHPASPTVPDRGKASQFQP